MDIKINKHIDYKSKLAGHIDDEKLFSKKEDYEWNGFIR